MFLSDSLVWALSSELVNVSGVKVFCDSKDRNDSMNCFIELFKQNWTQAIAEAEEQYDDVETDVDAVPIRTELTEYGFFIDVDPLDIKYDYGDYYDLELGRTALEQSLLGIKDKFSSINYEGHIAFPVSDVHCGGIAGWEVAPQYAKIKKDKTYDFVGEKLGKILNEVVNETEESDFWAELSSWFENEWDIEETIEVLFAYSQWIEKNTFERIIERIVEIAEEIDEDSIDEYNESSI